MNFKKIAHYFLLAGVSISSPDSLAMYYEGEPGAAVGWGQAAWDLGASAIDVCTWPARAAYGKVAGAIEVATQGGPDAGRFFSDHSAQLCAIGAVTTAAVLGIYYLVRDYQRVKQLKTLRDTWIVPLIALADNPGNIALANAWLGLSDADFNTRVHDIESKLGILGVRRGYVWSFVPSMDRAARAFDLFVSELRSLCTTRTVGDRDRFKVIINQVDEIVLAALDRAEREAIKDLAKRTREVRLERETQQRNDQALHVVRHGGGGSQQQQMGAPNVFFNVMPAGYGAQPAQYRAGHAQPQVEGPRVEELE